MVSELKNNNIPASLSNTAGTFVCNHIMYGLLYLINKKHPNIKGGFIHVPYIAEQVITKPNTPFMDLDKVAKGLTFAIKAAVENKEDLNITLGRIC